MKFLTSHSLPTIDKYFSSKTTHFLGHLLQSMTYIVLKAVEFMDQCSPSNRICSSQTVHPLVFLSSFPPMDQQIEARWRLVQYRFHQNHRFSDCNCKVSTRSLVLSVGTILITSVSFPNVDANYQKYGKVRNFNGYRRFFTTNDRKQL